jgi:hypothetical protein
LRASETAINELLSVSAPSVAGRSFAHDEDLFLVSVRRAMQELVVAASFERTCDLPAGSPAKLGATT